MNQYSKLIQSWENKRINHRNISLKMRTEIIQKGNALFKKYGISKVILFGSVNTGTSHPASDIDLLTIPLSAEQYWRFRHELEELINYPVDLYTQDDDARFVAKILTRGEIIYEV